MAELFLHGKRIASVFQLLGDHENDITYSVGWALAHSPAFLQAFLDAVIVPGLDCSEAVLRLQEYASGQGITDIEIEAAGRFHVIVEAKRGWTLPTQDQSTVVRIHVPEPEHEESSAQARSDHPSGLCRAHVHSSGRVQVSAMRSTVHAPVCQM